MKRSKLAQFALLGTVALMLVNCAGKKPCDSECKPGKQAAVKAVQQPDQFQLPPKERDQLERSMNEALNNRNDGGGGLPADPGAPVLPDGIPDAAPAGLMRSADGQTLIVRQGLQQSPAFNNPFLNPARSQDLAVHQRRLPRGVASVQAHGGNI